MMLPPVGGWGRLRQLVSGRCPCGVLQVTVVLQGSAVFCGWESNGYALLGV